MRQTAGRYLPIFKAKINLNAHFKRDWADKMDAHFDVREYAQLAKEYALPCIFVMQNCDICILTPALPINQLNN